MTSKIKAATLIGLTAGLLILAGCTFKYSFTGASIPPEAKTFSVQYFPNNAPMVAPMLSSTLTDALQDRFTRQTRLTMVREEGDLAIEGEITGYMSMPSAITSDQFGEGASTNRLSITVRVRFTNVFQPDNSFTDRSFTQFLEYDSQRSLQEVENTLIPEIVDMLVDDIFNAAVSNW